MNINKMLLLAYIAMLIPAITVANPAVRQDVVNTLDELGITKMLQNHETRITNLEKMVNQMWNNVYEDKTQEVVMKLSVKYNQSLSIDDTVCYPEEDICITIEK